MDHARDYDMVPQIPFSVPDITQREIDAVSEALRGGHLTNGRHVEMFEKTCAAASRRQFGVAVSSGTAAIHCMLLASGVGPGHEVITSPFCFISATNAILQVGAKPVYADIHTQTLNIDPLKLEAAITLRTEAIIGLEALGHPGGLDEVEEVASRHGLILLENACDAFGGSRNGRATGSYGRASCFSFHPSMTITSAEGGMIVTDDARFAEVCRSLRDQGREGSPWPVHSRQGFSYRMSELHAALGLAQYARHAEIAERRRKVVAEYFERLMDYRYVTLPTIQSDVTMSWFAFVVRLNDLFEPGDRDQILIQMLAEGVECERHFPAAHLQPHVMQQVGTKRGDYPVCEYISERTLSLPLFAAMTRAQVAHVCEALDRAIEQVLMGRCKGRF